MSSSCFVLTESLHQKLNAGCVGCQCWTYSRVDAHVRQHPNQLHQHIVLHAHRRSGRFAGRGGPFLWLFVWWHVSSLVAVVKLKECLRAAFTLEELLPSLIAFGCEVPKSEEKAHNKVLWVNSGESVSYF